LYGEEMDRELDRLPIVGHQTASEAVFTPEALIEAVRSERGLGAQAVPAVCVLDFDGDLSDWMVGQGLVEPCESWACFHTAMHEFEIDGVRCGLIARTIGGPYAVLVAEQLAVSGARVVLGLTSAGRVDPQLPIPSIVVASRAVRDEGTSYHYLPPAETVAAPAEVPDLLLAELRRLPLPVCAGMVWTTDAPYRETAEELAAHARAGVLAVEMQAASLFAFAEAKGFPVGVVAHVTNAVDHAGTPFDKGVDVSAWEILQAMCRGGMAYLRIGEGSANLSECRDGSKR
jgi:uridine phosphorylase